MLTLNPEAINLATLRQLWQGAPCRLDAAAMERVAASAASVERIVASGETVYGVNTGFGLLANQRIPADRLAELQRNLILSHSCGLGDPLPRPRPSSLSTIINRVTWRGSGSPSPQLCDRMRLRCSSASRSAGMRWLASRPKPVLTP